MATTTTRLALTKPAGTDVVDIDVLNANADKIDANIGYVVCTSTTRPASPYSGMVILETDTGFVLTYQGGSWKSSKGVILQIQRTQNNAQVLNYTTSYIGTGTAINFTPKSTNSTILVLVSQNGILKQTGGSSESAAIIRLVRDTTEVLVLGALVGYSPSVGYLAGLSVSAQYSEQNTTTTTRTYSTQFKNYATGVGVSAQHYNEFSTITVIEVSN